MPNIATQVVMQGASNLPEDRFVNTFHFTSTGPFATVAGAIATSLDTRWDTIGTYISPYVSRNYQIKSYDLSTAEPRVPTTSDHVMGAVGSATGSIPEEVAAVCSFRGAPPVTARRRGRVFIGPLNSNALSAANTGTPTRVNSSFIAAMNSLWQSFASSGAGDFTWCIWSPTDAAMVPIVGGWTDNAFDTMRKRGPKATVRTTWSVV